MFCGKLIQRPAAIVATPHLVAALGIFFGVVGDANHLGDGNGVQAAEGLE